MNSMKSGTQFQSRTWKLTLDTTSLGINSLPSLEDYCKIDPVYHYAPVSDRISRDRFTEISRYLHFVDNSTLSLRTSPAYRLGKIRPILTHLQSQFSVVHTPGQDFVIDEAMIKFQGWSSMKQYMAMKITKRGIKV